MTSIRASLVAGISAAVVVLAMTAYFPHIGFGEVLGLALQAQLRSSPS